MPRKQRPLPKNSSQTAVPRRAFRPSQWYRPGLEPLEDRTLLTGYFNQIADTVTGPAGAMANITHGLHAIDSLTRLPLINMPINQIGQITNSLEVFRLDLDTKLRSLDDASAK